METDRPENSRSDGADGWRGCAEAARLQVGVAALEGRADPRLLVGLPLLPSCSLGGPNRPPCSAGLPLKVLRCQGGCCARCALACCPRIWCSCADDRCGRGSTSLSLERAAVLAAVGRAGRARGSAGELSGAPSSQASASSWNAPSSASIHARSGSGRAAAAAAAYAPGAGREPSRHCWLRSCVSQSAWSGEDAASRLASVASASEVMRGRGSKGAACRSVGRAVGAARAVGAVHMATSGCVPRHRCWMAFELYLQASPASPEAYAASHLPGQRQTAGHPAALPDRGRRCGTWQQLLTPLSAAAVASPNECALRTSLLEGACNAM